MKIFNVLGGLLLLLVSAHGDEEDLFVACSEFWLQVKIRRAPFVDELQPQPYELYLGTGCPVSRILPSYFEFIYTLTSCGIRKYERLWGILIESSVSYEPVFLNVRGHVPISCSIQSSEYNSGDNEASK
nr:oocyte-secreted protein 4A [Oryctolagus cuniculus]